MQTAVTAYDAVIVDAGSHLDEPSLTALDRADGVVFTVSTRRSPPSGRSTRSSRSSARSVGRAAKATFVLNNMFAREILKMRDIESALGTQDRGRAAVRPVRLPQGGQRGRPGRPGSAALAAGRAAIQLAAIAFGEDVAATVPVEEEEHKSGFGLFGGLRRRRA